MTWEHAIIHEQGQRASQEDRSVLIELGPARLFIGVFDGHGGPEAAEIAARLLPTLFRQHLDGEPEPTTAFERAYCETDQRLTRVEGGTTAVTAFLDHDRLVCANVGDGRLLVVGETVRQLSTDHRVENPAERERVVHAGAAIEPPYVIKAGAGLMPTRSLGDHFFRDVGIIPEPSITTHELRPDDHWIVAGTDGLFDYLKNDSVAEILRRSRSAQASAESIRTLVLREILGTDNLTVIILKRKP